MHSFRAPPYRKVLPQDQGWQPALSSLEKGQGDGDRLGELF